ncbi:MAG: hypothetical protein ACXACI_17710, partial [Candidatus Hodarchaeales archaeon]
MVKQVCPKCWHKKFADKPLGALECKNCAWVFSPRSSLSIYGSYLFDHPLSPVILLGIWTLVLVPLLYNSVQEGGQYQNSYLTFLACFVSFLLGMYLHLATGKYGETAVMADVMARTRSYGSRAGEKAIGWAADQEQQVQQEAKWPRR